ncbi:hypothetical protein ACHWQZ_G007358 [Mnemiopsis leidyi]
MVRKANTKVRKARVKKDKESSLVFNCTSCAQPQLLVQGKRNILCHPQLQVGVCRECLIFAHADVIPLDEEGYEIYCRWCSELGNLVCCDECKSPFCEECISRNIGPEYYDSLMDIDEWKCFICEPAAIESLRELAKAALDHQNYNDPSDLLLEKCSAIFNGDADLNDSDREEIVKERLRLRRNNLNETFNRKKKEKAEAEEKSESNSGKSDNVDSEDDEQMNDNKKKKADSGSEYESSPESPKKEEDSVASDGSDADSLPSVEVSDKKSTKRKQSTDNESEASNETLDLEKKSKKGVKSERSAKSKETDSSDSDSELMEPKRKSRNSKSYNLSLKNQKKSNLRNPVKKPKYASSDEKSESSD